MRDRRKTRKEIGGAGERRSDNDKRQRGREKGAIGAGVEETPVVEYELVRDVRKEKEQDSDDEGTRGNRPSEE